MTDFFVNKSGNDADSGLTRALAKLTIQAALNIAFTGDRVFVGPGEYNEAIIKNISGGNNPDIEIIAEQQFGPTVLDGQNVLADGAVLGGAGIGGAAGQLTIQGFVIRNYTDDGIDNNSTSNGSIRIENCIIHDIGSRGYETGSRGAAIIDSVFRDCNIGLQTSTRDNIQRCTVFNNAKGQAGSNNNIRNCNFLRNTRHVELTLAPSNPDLFNFNFFFPIGVANDLRSADLTVHTTLASWQGSAGTPDLNSKDIDPLVVDEARKMLRPSLSSSLPTAFVNDLLSPVEHAGFEPLPTKGLSNSADLANWDTNAILTGLTKNGAGNHELTTPPDGTYRSGVMDFGTSRVVDKIDLHGVENYFAEVFDFDKTDVEPNFRSLRYRGSDTTFLPSDAVIPWVEIKWDENIGLAFRFFQVEVTLRSDGVAA